MANYVAILFEPFLLDNFLAKKFRLIWQSVLKSV